MFFRWLHKSWKYFWGIILSLLLVLAIVGGGIIGLLQLDVTQDYLSDRIQQQVEESYHAELSVGGIDGFLPFYVSLHDVVLSRTDTVSSDTLASVKTIDSQIDVWGLLQNRLTITGFSTVNPRVWLRSDNEGKLQFMNPREQKGGTEDRSADGSWFRRVEIVAPALEITNGLVSLESATSENKVGNLPRSFSVDNINASFFLDWSSEQRYLDIESFSAETKGLEIQNLSFFGQVYNDNRFLEFNSFHLNLGDSQFILNGEIDGVNLLEPDFTSQLLAATYNLRVQSDQLYPRDLEDLIPGVPYPDPLFTLDFEAEGTLESLQVDYASLGLGESALNLTGTFTDMRKRKSFAYEVNLEELELHQEDIKQLADSLTAPQYRALENLVISGQAAGTLDSLDADLQLESPIGKMTVKGQSQLAAPYKYSGTASGGDINIGALIPTTFDTTSLTFDAELNGSGLTVKNAVSKLEASFYNSRINDITFDQLELTSSITKGLWENTYDYRSGSETFSGSGSIDFGQDHYPLTLQGSAENINLKQFFSDSSIAETNLNFDYNVDFPELDLDRLYGRANLDIRPSVIGQDSVRSHQFYMDLNDPEAQNRSFRLTSSLLDMSIKGEIVPGDIVRQAQFWVPYLRDQFKAEVLLDSTAVNQSVSASVPEKKVVLEGSIKTKDLSLIQKYFPAFPTIHTDSEISFSANTDGRRLLLSAQMLADTLQYNTFNFSNSRTQMTASFRSDRKLKEFSTVDWETSIASLKTPSVNMDSLEIDLAVERDSVFFTQQVGRISDDTRFQMTVDSELSDSTVSVSIQDFFLGNDVYSWTNEKQPSFTYKGNGNIAFNDFSFQNRNEYFRLQGTLSKNRSDSLIYVLRDINLQRISDLIKGKIDFSGIMNGTLTTRSLTSQPTIQGELGVEQFRLNNRLVGDVDFKSRYNPNKNQFDTRIDIITDSTKYENYLDSNDDIGQNIRLDGYFVTPDPQAKQDTVFYFDADFDQIDMWVVPLIVDNIFKDMEGQAYGEGYITGNLDDFDFHADFEAENVFAKPRFVNTNYFVNGSVGLDRQEGVVLDSLGIMDTKGGKGTVWGTIDLNDFKPITYLDLTLNMNRLQFLNSTMDPDVPFFGNVSGTGEVRLTGANNDMYMQTVDPVRVTGDSEVSIPLLEETELNESGKFIRFVDSFDEEKEPAQFENGEDEQQLDEEELEEAIESMTFSERFDLDLRFDASENITVNLIFDPVTGEVLRSQGTGQLRITMQDQDVQMFGQFGINGGSYQFVTGEIISRRLQLEQGGTIIWEGPPDNARLDISAVFNARPNVATLTSETALESQNQNGGQQVPVELIVEINGTLNSVENNYYFRLPSSLDLSSNSTLSYTINEINRDEQQKLLQATSILFTGQFIPTQGTESSTASLSQSLTRGSTVLNPLLSNQVISPLLSNQINALLNSDVSRFDVDFNLNAYNEVDLGIALRLYNDRLILRREGQITGGGPQNSLGDRIGDLNATYRIRRGLSLTAFHRQDQVLNSLGGGTGSQAGDITPSVDGIGLESQIQYNTWGELFDRIKNVFNHIFGIKKDDE